MPFPYLPRENENEALFRVDDPFGLRRAITPLFAIDSRTDEITGLGTSFRVDPWGTHLTAFHVLENRDTHDFFEAPTLGGVFGFVSPGLVFGTPPIPRDCFVSIREAATIRGKRESPLIHLPSETVNVFDCAKFIFDPSNPHIQKYRYWLPMQIRGGRTPVVGDRVMAMGYPGVMNVRHQHERNVVSFTEGMYAAIGTIIEVLPQGRNSNRPWPTFVVSCKWPSGMSGGPIFNEDGNVIGLVSSSLYNPDIDEMTEGYSFWFRPAAVVDQFLPLVDPDNAGWFRGFGVVRREPWHFAGIFTNPELANTHRERLGNGYEVILGSNRMGSDDFSFQ